jgi:hypothetical protein
MPTPFIDLMNHSKSATIKETLVNHCNISSDLFHPGFNKVWRCSGNVNFSGTDVDEM